MAQLRTTIVIDDFLASKIRQMFNGNLSFGISKIIEDHLTANDPLKKAYGIHKGWKINSQQVKDELREEWGD